MILNATSDIYLYFCIDSESQFFKRVFYSKHIISRGNCPFSTLNPALKARQINLPISATLS